MAQVDNVHQALLSFSLWVRCGLKPSIQNVIELKRANPTGLKNPVLMFVVPRAMEHVVDRFVLEVVQAWDLLNTELRRQNLRSLGVSHKDYRHLKRIRNKLLAHRIENKLKTKRHEVWYKSRYGNYESVLALVERVAERVDSRIKRLEFTRKLYAKSHSANVVQAITQGDIQALLEALKKHGIY